MQKFLILLMVLGALVSTGCAAKQASDYSGAETAYVEPVIPQVVKNRIDEANRTLDNGDYAEALRLYDEVLEDYTSDDGEFNCAVQTNQAMAALAIGDRDQFLFYADLVRDNSLKIKHPSNNTRWVLAVRQGFRNERARDLRVSQGLHDAVFRTLRGEGG